MNLCRAGHRRRELVGHGSRRTHFFIRLGLGTSLVLPGDW